MYLPPEFPVEEIETTLEANAWLHDAFNKKRPFSYIRLGNTEAICICLLMNGKKVPRKIKPWLSINAGVFPDSNDFLRDSFLPLNLSAIYSADCLSFVPNQELAPLHTFSKLNLNAKLIDSNWISDPLMLSYMFNHYPSFTPWTINLRNKKILFITPFIDSFNYQKGKIDLVWPEKSLNIILPGTTLSAIKSPFNPAISGEHQYNSFGQRAETWTDQLIILKEKISKIDFDVALIGAGAYGPSLAEFIKSCGKIGITTAGNTQLFFGVNMHRWSDLSIHKELINQHWLDKPFNSDIPRRQDKINKLERAYW